MKSIEVLVKADGAIKVEAKGFVGMDCEKATKQLEEALGSAGNRIKTKEYFARAGAQQTVKAKS